VTDSALVFMQVLVTLRSFFFFFRPWQLLWFHWSCDCDPIGHLCGGGSGYCRFSGLWHQV